jgi:hypothetical protein
MRSETADAPLIKVPATKKSQGRWTVLSGKDSSGLFSSLLF